MVQSTNITKFIYYNKLKQLLSLNMYKEIVFFCVGNYKIWYDCFAAELSEELRKLKLKLYIYGGRDFPIIPDNLLQYCDFVNKKHPNACIIVVDNLLTFSSAECGEVVISNRMSNIAYFSQNLTFGDISLLLKTYPYNNPYSFLNIQTKTVNNIIDVIKILYKND